MLHWSKDRIAVVLGGTSSIGRHFVENLARKGLHVEFSYFKQLEEAERLQNEYKGFAYASRVNVMKEEDIELFFKNVYEKYDRLDILLNVFGTTADAKISDMRYEDWQKVINMNLGSVFLSCKYASQYMKKNSFGRIINIGSILGQMGSIGGANYSAAKSGLEGLTKSLARELARDGITVNLASLGFMDAGMGRRLPERVIAHVLHDTPLHKLGDPDKVTRFVLALASEEADYITGQTVGINGGCYM